jgi:hypothetical protein
VTLTGLLGITVFNVLVCQAGHTTQALNLALIAVCAPVVIVRKPGWRLPARPCRAHSGFCF